MRQSHPRCRRPLSVRGPDRTVTRDRPDSAPQLFETLRAQSCGRTAGVKRFPACGEQRPDSDPIVSPDETPQLHPLVCRVALRLLQLPGGSPPRVSSSAPFVIRARRREDSAAASKCGLTADAQLRCPDRASQRYAALQELPAHFEARTTPYPARNAPPPIWDEVPPPPRTPSAPPWCRPCTSAPMRGHNGCARLSGPMPKPCGSLRWLCPRISRGRVRSLSDGRSVRFAR